MLTKLTIRNFKSFTSVEIDLGNPVVFIGPNNSGKTSALQALALWDLGLRKWREKRGAGEALKRPGIIINRKDFVSAQVPNAKLLWRDRFIQSHSKSPTGAAQKTVFIEILVTGFSEDVEWECGFEFQYANEEGFYCRPLRKTEGRNPERYPVPEEAHGLRISFLPPMSGLTAQEFIKSPGEIGYLVGQGRTAEVLRNLCYQVVNSTNDDAWLGWVRLSATIEDLFGIVLSPPELSGEHAEITMSYTHGSKDCALDISSAGRGVQQILLLLAYMAVNPGAIILLDEPDAHLEIIRQREIYRILSNTAELQNSQIIMASHSEVILNEAAEKDVVVAFVGAPHRLNDKAQLLKSLREIGYDQYYLAEEVGFVLYLEGSTDLAILQSFAESLDHPAKSYLQRPFVHYVSNQPQRARQHFHGLKEAKPDLVGFVLCDKLDRPVQDSQELAEYMWQRREIENYLCQPATLERFAQSLSTGFGPLFEGTEGGRLLLSMREAIRLQVPPIALADLNDRWWTTVKASEDFLEPVFEFFFKSTKHQNLIRKTNFHRLAPFVAVQDISEEIVTVLDLIESQSLKAKPVLA
jgi:ABC-type transport system involved in cytochrome c biogenesis ATPase subunit